MKFLKTKIKKLVCVIFLFLFGVSIYFQSEIVLRKKISQMLIVGFNGTVLTKDNPIYDDILKERVSGVIIFSKDSSKLQNVDGKADTTKNVTSPEQLKNLIEDMQKISKQKLFFAIDEEGGQISRLPKKYGFDVETLSHQKLGKLNDTQTTYNEAKKIAKTLKFLGINFNFAPCVDLSLNEISKVIYKKERSFSRNPQVVVAHAKEFIKAHREENILTSIKHFPGHGSVSADTHKGFVDATQNWQEIELEPYKTLINENFVDSIMISHIYNSNFDKKFPSSLSYNTIQKLLKEKLNYQGLVVTDDLQMNAITSNYDFETSIVNAINAGSDIVILGNNLKYNPNAAKEFNDTVYYAVKKGKIKRSQINKSHKKIMQIKKKLS